MAFQTNSESYLEWVDIFHRLVEAGYYLIATEITPETANPILGGLLHYGSSGRFMLLINAPGGDHLDLPTEHGYHHTLRYVEQAVSGLVCLFGLRTQ